VVGLAVVGTVVLGGVVFLVVVGLVGLVVRVVVLALVVVGGKGEFSDFSDLANTLSDSDLKILPEIDCEVLWLMIKERTIAVNSKFLKIPIKYYYTVMIRKIGYFASFKD
jgi:hypothetical protein